MGRWALITALFSFGLLMAEEDGEPVDVQPEVIELELPVEDLEFADEDLQRLRLIIGAGGIEVVDMRVAPAGVDQVDAADGEGDEAAPAVPGRAEPLAPAPAMAWRVQWDEYVTVIVVEPGKQVRRPAWVATIEQHGHGGLAVAYAGSAFIDAVGDIHIDCQRALISGPQGNNWSPDSFAIQPDDRVRVIDDYDRGNMGRVLRALPMRTETGEVNEDWMRERVLARSMVEGGL